MSKISKSPDRHSFQKGGYVQRLAEKGEDPSEAYLDLFDKILYDHEHKFDDPQSRINNMEYDLLTNDWILEKVRTDDAYAQNLYAAMCNNDFIKMEIVPILRQDPDKDFWSASWRYAGGIIADMQQKGDYIDWYCSGIRNVGVYAPDELDDVPKELTEEQLAHLEITKRYVPEGCITEEIRNDLQRLGWAVGSDGDWKKFE
jgi:hypothetical protein